MLKFLKQNAWFLLVSLAFLGVLVVTDFFWNHLYLKISALVLWTIDTTMVIYRWNKTKTQARQCPECNLFVPLDTLNDAYGLVPHCCYAKPKEIK